MIRPLALTVKVGTSDAVPNEPTLLLTGESATTPVFDMVASPASTCATAAFDALPTHILPLASEGSEPLVTAMLLAAQLKPVPQVMARHAAKRVDAGPDSGREPMRFNGLGIGRDGGVERNDRPEERPSVAGLRHAIEVKLKQSSAGRR